MRKPGAGTRGCAGARFRLASCVVWGLSKVGHMQRTTTIYPLTIAAALLSTGCGGDDAAPAEGANEAGGLALVADAGCAIIDCPDAEHDCCTEVFAAASGGSDVDFVRRNELVEVFDQSSEAVRAEFAFDAANQSGRIVFNLAKNVSIYRLRLVATFSGAVDTEVGVTLSDALNQGCAFGFSTLDGVPIAGSMAASHAADLSDDEYCFNGVPGLGSVLEIASYSTRAGAGVLEIESIELLSPDTLE